MTRALRTWEESFGITYRYNPATKQFELLTDRGDWVKSATYNEVADNFGDADFAEQVAFVEHAAANPYEAEG